MGSKKVRQPGFSVADTYLPQVHGRRQFARAKTHVRQWYAALAIWLLLCALLSPVVSPVLWPVCGLAPLVHPVLYKLVRPYRQWCEVQAYRKQIAVGGYLSNDFAVAALVEKYDFKLSAGKARALLFD